MEWFFSALGLIGVGLGVMVAYRANRKTEQQGARSESGNRLDRAIALSAANDTRQQKVGLALLHSLVEEGSLQDEDVALARVALQNLAERGRPEDFPYGTPVAEDEVATGLSRVSPGQVGAARALIQLDEGGRGTTDAVSELANQDNVLVIRLGGYRELDDDPDRSVAGFREDMTWEQLRDATRMWWKMSAVRAERVRYVVAAAQGVVREIYEVDPVEPYRIREEDQRLSFTVRALSDPMRRLRIAAAAAERLGSLTAGAANPVAYVSVAGV